MHWGGPGTESAPSATKRWSDTHNQGGGLSDVIYISCKKLRKYELRNKKITWTIYKTYIHTSHAFITRKPS